MVAALLPSQLRAVLIVVSGLVCAACTDSSADPISSLRPLVGVWEAQVLQVPDPENLDEVVDVIPQGASYTLSVLATGQFTAVFDLVLARGYEAGRVAVSGNQVTLTPTSPPGTGMSGTWQIQEGRLVIDGIRSLDLDGDGTPEVIPFFVELVEREL